MAVYQQLYGSGELEGRVDKAKSILGECYVCSHCGVNRLASRREKYHTTHQVMVPSYEPHFGEVR